jgi:N-acetylmuramoyl-L-alanine amidase
MIVLAYYLLKVIVCSGILFLYYHLALRNKVFHQWNRFYLLAIVVLSLIVPLLQFTFSHQPQENGPVHLLQVVQSADMYMEEIYIRGHQSFSTEQWTTLGYAIVSSVLLLTVIVSLIKLYKILHRHQVQQIKDIKFIGTQEPGTPFSFFQYIFWNNKIDINSPTGQHIFQHELVHVKEGHTFDKLFMQIVLVVFWCNPFFWFIRHELQLVHEFIADKKAVQQHDTAAFAAMILQAAYPHSFSQITNQFFQSSIKRRLAMLTKIQNPGINYLSRIVALPLIAFVVLAFTYRADHKDVIALEQPMVVVIDAGHGKMANGSMNGAKGNGIYEDDIVLALAKKVKELNINPNVKIVLTRTSDENVDLKKRTQIAGENSANMFISLHVAAAPDGGKRNGMEVYVSNKNTPFQQESEKLASVMKEELSSVYTTNPKLIKRQVGVWVIDHNVCPSILVECGYITNQQDRKFITNDDNQKLVAEKILRAIQRFAASNEQNKGLGATQSSHTFISDSITFSASGFENKAKKPLVIINNKETSFAQLNGKTVVAKKVISYSENDATAIKKYGARANYGVLIFENAQIVEAQATDTIPRKIIAMVETVTVAKVNGRDSAHLIFKDGTRKTIPYAEAKRLGIIDENTVTIKNVVVEGRRTGSNHTKTNSVTEGSSLKEVVVEGYPTNKAISGSSSGHGHVKEVFVQGHQSKEVIVHGYPGNTITSNSNAGTGQVKEVVVQGYATKSNKLPGDERILRIPLTDFNELKSWTAHQLAQVEKTDEIISFDFTIDLDNGDIKVLRHIGNELSAADKNFLDKYVKPGKLVTIDNIRIKKDGKEVKWGARVYRL